MDNDSIFDADDYEDVTEAELAIKNPKTGAPTGAVFTIAGPEHAVRKALRFTRMRKARALLQKTGKMPVNDPEDDERNTLAEIIASVLGWRDFKVGGKLVEYSPEAVKAIVGNPKRGWLRAQVHAGLEEAELFIKGSPNS